MLSDLDKVCSDMKKKKKKKHPWWKATAIKASSPLLLIGVHIHENCGNSNRGGQGKITWRFRTTTLHWQHMRLQVMTQLHRFTLHALHHQLPSSSACTTVLAQKLKTMKGFVGFAADTNSFLIRGLQRQQWVGYIPQTSPGQKSNPSHPSVYKLLFLFKWCILHWILLWYWCQLRVQAAGAPMFRSAILQFLCMK